MLADGVVALLMVQLVLLQPSHSRGELNEQLVARISVDTGSLIAGRLLHELGVTDISSIPMSPTERD